MSILHKEWQECNDGWRWYYTILDASMISNQDIHCVLSNRSMVKDFKTSLSHASSSNFASANFCTFVGSTRESICGTIKLLLLMNAGATFVYSNGK